jgi:hypothetical protein
MAAAHVIRGATVSAVPQAQLDPSAVIGEAFNTYKQHAGVLIPAALGVYAIQAIAAIALSSNTLGALLLNIISLVLAMIYTGAVVQLVRDVQDGQLDSTPGQLISSVIPVLLPLFFVSLIAGLLIGVGMILFLAPGFYLATIFAVVGPVTVIEKPGVFAALSRSQALVKGSGWQVFGIIALVIALSFVAAAITAIIGVPLGTVGRVIVQWLASSVLAPIGALATATAYLRLRDVHGEPPLAASAATAPSSSGISGIPGA